VERLGNFLCVCAGSALGGGLRYGVSLAVGARAFPWATLIVNVVGCFLIALISTIAVNHTVPANLRLFLTTGIMGGLTTYSTFDWETTAFFQDRAPALAFANVGATLVVCFVAGWLGILVARTIG
jgi:fluoride exporter